MVSETAKTKSKGEAKKVLILIVVEYGLGDPSLLGLIFTDASLNPYCSGIWSRRRGLFVDRIPRRKVLILIVVEYGLGGLSI